jgi:hypothetical protein
MADSTGTSSRGQRIRAWREGGKTPAEKRRHSQQYRRTGGYRGYQASKQMDFGGGGW